MKKFIGSVVIILSTLLSTGRLYGQLEIIENTPELPCNSTCWDFGTKESCKQWSVRNGYGAEPDTLISDCPTEGCGPENEGCASGVHFYKKTGPTDTWNKQAQNLVCSANSRKIPKIESPYFRCLKAQQCTCVQPGGGNAGCGKSLNEEHFFWLGLKDWGLENTHACTAIDPP